MQPRDLLKGAALLVLCSLAYAREAYEFQDQCKTTNNCSCTFAIGAPFEFHCTGDDPNVVIKVWQGRQGVHVNCMQTVNWSEQNLPAVQVGDVQFLILVECPLPTEGLAHLMRRFGIDSTKAYKFDFFSLLETKRLTSSYFEGLHKVEWLKLNNGNITYVEEDVFKPLQNVIKIELKFNRIQPVSGMFKYSTKLEELYLNANELTSLPPNLFDDLTELKELYLRTNNLTIIDSSLFKNLHKLQLLELSYNQITQLSPDVFYNLRNLKMLNLENNNLQAIESSLFKNNELLESMNMNRNPGLILPDNLFSNLTNLKKCTLNECDLTRLPNNLFDRASRLRHLTLNNNNLESVPENLFNDLGELEELDLSHNSIKDLPEKVFSSLERLRTLNLEKNLLTTIQRKLFSNLLSLETLHLENNRINTIDVHSFRMTRSLKELVISNNDFDLPRFPDPLFSNNVLLERVDLSYNNITSITNEFAETLINLKELDLSHNHITHLSFNNLKTPACPIKILLSHNKISNVDFSNAELLGKEADCSRIVHLDGNSVTCNCFMLDFVMYLKHRNHAASLVQVKTGSSVCKSPRQLDGVSLNKLQPDMLVCSLDQVGVQDTAPAGCSYTLRPWDKALVLNCSNNLLSEVPKLDLPSRLFFNHTEVHLERNRLTTGPKANMGYENVTKLFLSHNNISEVPWLPPKIEVLKLDHNNVSHLNDHIMRALNASSVMNVTLGYNPWTCDCSIVNLFNVLVSNVVGKQIDTNNIICENNGQPLIQASISDVCPTVEPFALGFGIAVTLMGLTIAILTVLYYRFEQEFKIWLFAHNLLLRFVSEEDLDKDKSYDAFISFAHKDEPFVMKELRPMLEEGPYPYKLCLHFRDWVAGEFISKQITNSIAQSRRTIVVLSRNFLKSEWGKMEFRTAHQQALQERRARVILVIYGDIDLNSDLDDELKVYVKTNTYIKWGDPWFWNRLRYALPHSRIMAEKLSQKSKNMIVSLSEKACKVDDKVDLISSAPSTPTSGTTPPIIDVTCSPFKHDPLSFTPSTVINMDK